MVLSLYFRCTNNFVVKGILHTYFWISDKVFPDIGFPKIEVLYAKPVYQKVYSFINHINATTLPHIAWLTWIDPLHGSTLTLK